MKKAYLIYTNAGHVPAAVCRTKRAAVGLIISDLLDNHDLKFDEVPEVRKQLGSKGKYKKHTLKEIETDKFLQL